MEKEKEILGIKEYEQRRQEYIQYWKRLEKKYDFIGMTILLLLAPAVFIFLIREAGFEMNGLLVYVISDVFFLVLHYFDGIREQKKRENERFYFEENREALLRKLEELAEWEEAQEREAQEREEQAEHGEKSPQKKSWFHFGKNSKEL